MGKGWLAHPLTSAYVRGIEQACSERSFHPLVELFDASTGVPRCVQESKIDGVLVKASNELAAFYQMIDPALPMVGLSTYEPTVPIAQAIPDNRAAGWTVAEHLWNRGHRRIAFVCSESGHRMFIPRYQGYEEFLRLKNAFRPELVQMWTSPADRREPQNAFPDTAQAVERLWAFPAEQRPTAVVACNDWNAGGVYLAASSLGIRIPEELSVVGFDNAVATCCALRPELTSFEIPFTQTAYVAAIALLDQIQDEHKRTQTNIQMVRGQLVERQSVATIGCQD